MVIVLVKICLVLSLSIYLAFAPDPKRASKSSSQYLKNAAQAIKNGNIDEALSILDDALLEDPFHLYANQLISAAYFEKGKYSKAAAHLKLYLEEVDWIEPTVIASYMEALRGAHKLEEALSVGRKYQEQFASSASLLFSLAVVEEETKHYDEALKLYYRVMKLNANKQEAWFNALDILLNGLEVPNTDKAIKLCAECLKLFPDAAELLYLCGFNHQLRGNFQDALDAYNKVLAKEPTHYNALTYSAVANQALGRSTEALELYQRAQPFQAEDCESRTNFATLLGALNRRDEQERWLKEAVEKCPTNSESLVSLGGYYRDEGRLEEAETILVQAANMTNNPHANALRLSAATMLPPVAASWSEMLRYRRRMERHLRDLLMRPWMEQATLNISTGSTDRPNSRNTVSRKAPLELTQYQVHFYLPYHGLNDRNLQEMVSRANTQVYEGISDIHPRLVGTSSGAFNITSGLNSDPYSTDLNRSMINASPKDVVSLNRKRSVLYQSISACLNLTDSR